MATRWTKDKLRTETPRLKDLPRSDGAARDPTEGRDAQGRFASGNRVGCGRHIRHLIRRGLGDPNAPQTADLVREATTIYLGVLRSLPSAGPGVMTLVAAQARHTVLATYYANESAKTGLSTPDGLKLAEASRAHDTTAQRLSVTAYDRAVREAAAQPKANPRLDWLTKPLPPKDPTQ